MKRYLSILITVIFFSACKSSEKLVNEGNYDKAIDKSIKTILKGRYDAEDVLLLDKAYKLANTRDLERVKLLKAEAKPENWEQIFFTYSALDNRQKEVRKVLPLQAKGKTYDYNQVDYTNSIVEAKTNAAKYFYENGSRLMEVGDKGSYREAYHNFNKAKSYRASDYPLIDQLIADARYFGTSRVLIDVANTSPFRFPPEFYDDLLAINTDGLNNMWVEYYLGRTDRDVEYDYFVTILLKNVVITPERYSQKEYNREKEVPDGFSYALDSRGNVRKDSLGNDIKIPKYKKLFCTVVERHQTKSATLEAQIEYLTMQPNRRVMKLVPVSATSVFEHFSGRARGDMEALLPEDLKLIERDAVAFPDDLSMLYDCIPTLQQAISDAMRDNKNLIH
ncbi:MAG: hypothetical protein JXA77_02415 [Bacteroidales bacterium]|nr:hypothetical protein [Bacteroidales bacterium]MBN2817794.1 hypothetical protein [Bacteroidales bacterium]